MKRVLLIEGGKRSNDLVRFAAIALARYAVNDAEGRDLGDPVHEWVTEGRRARNEARKKKAGEPPDYSSCGDLAHWMLYCLGCRDDRINREEHKKWRVQVNLSLLRESPWYVRAGSPMSGPSLGDIILVANRDDGKDAHVAVLISIEDSKQWVTSDYGQPYGRRRVCQIVDTPRGRVVRGKRLRGWVDLDRVPLELGALVPEDFRLGVDCDNPYLAD